MMKSLTQSAEWQTLQSHQQAIAKIQLHDLFIQNSRRASQLEFSKKIKVNW